MSDQADVMDALESIATTACFPNGTGAPSVTGKIIALGQGWPLAKDIDRAIADGVTLVSIYAIPGTTANVATPFDWNPGIVTAPVHGMSAQSTNGGFQLAGQPNVGEYATAIVNGSVFSVIAGAIDTIQSVAAQLALQIAAQFPGTTFAQGGVTIPKFSSLVVRIGAPATIGQIIHRQRQNFQITVWSPTPSDRTAVAAPIDVALKRSITITMPDTSEAFVLGTGSNLDDKREETSGYHRALIYSVQWDTLDEFPAWEITSVDIALQAQNLTTSASV